MTNRKTLRRRLHAEPLESRYCLTGLGFATHDIAVVELLEPVSQFADIDGDGHLDVVSAGGSSTNRTIAWHRNTDGKGTFENLQPMVSNISSFSSPFLTVDLDGDFDPDLLTVVPQSPGALANELVAFENVDGKGTFRKSHVLDSDTVPAVFTAIESADLDGDGDADVIASVLTFGTGSGRMIWYENIDGKGGFGEARVITNNFAVASRDIFAAGAPKAEDLDGDGDLDIVADSKHIDYDLDVIIWFENTNGRGDFSNGSTIAEASNFIGSEVVDFDGDDDLDILTVLNVENFLAADEQAIVWYENDNGDFGDPVLIPTDVQNVTSVIARDIDGDGAQDVLALSNDVQLISSKDSIDSSVTWYRNEDHLGRFVEQSTFDVLTARLVTGDADGDGDLDILASTSRENTVSWYENSDGLGLFAEPHIIVQATASAASVLMGDLDGDGDLDLVSASQTDIAWFENRDGASAYAKPQQIFDGKLIGSNDTQPRPAVLADVDGDDDLDVISMVNSDPVDGSNFAVWFENTNGMGDFGEKQVIGKIDTHAEQMLAADLDNDGDLDVLFSSPAGALPHSRVGWFENVDGKGDFGDGVSKRVISNMATAGFVAAVDMDQDGDLDVLSNDQRANPGVIWSENMGPESPGEFGDTHSIYARRDATRVIVADFDGDGDEDVITADYQQIAFVENLDDVEDFNEPRVIEVNHSHVYDIIPTDLDSDGDLDLVASLFDVTYPIVWYENQNGEGDFGERQLIRTLDGFTSSVAVHDINGDGNLDLIAASKTGLRWFEQRLPGDSNGDGIFNSSDLITAFAANEYEDQFNLNSTFQEGDWNGDGDFDSSDLVFVFQAGTYSANARMESTPTAVALNWIFIDRSEQDKQRLKKLKATTHEQSHDEQLV